MNSTVHTVADLGRSMPDIRDMFYIPHKEHSTFFYTFTNTDVWTEDGWLVTAIQEDGITIQIRKGTEVCNRKVKNDTAMYVAVDPELLYFNRFGMSRTEALSHISKL